MTGLGVLAPNGLGVEEYWEATLKGRSGIGELTRFDPASYPARLAGEVTGFVPAERLPGRLLPQTDHMTRMALVAAEWALADAGVRPGDFGEFDMGVITASASGGFEFGQRELEKLWSKGSEYVSAYQSFAWFYAVNTGQISIRNGMRGPGGVVVSDQAGGLDALAHARRQLRKGIRLVVSGGIDSALCPWGWVAQLANGKISRATDPATGYLPFGSGANGYLPGEGGAILILERGDARPDHPGYGEIAGYGATFDPAPGSGGEPGLRRAIEQALRDADADPGEVDVVFADASGVAEQDKIEADAIAEVFGPHGVPVTAPKTMTGRLYSGAAPLDVAAALLSVRDSVIPPTVHTLSPDPAYRMDLVTDARPVAVRTALVIARGHGGFNSALLVRGPNRRKQEGPRR